MLEEDKVFREEILDEMKIQLQDLQLINEDKTGLIALAAFQRLVEENINIRAKCKHISSKAKQYMVRSDQLKKLQTVILEQNSYIAEQNAFLREAAEEVDSQDKQIKALVSNLDEVYSKNSNSSNSDAENFTNKYKGVQVDFEFLEESRVLETAFYSDIVVAESIMNLTSDMELIGIEKAVSVEIENNTTAPDKTDKKKHFLESDSKDWVVQSINDGVISYRAPTEWIADDWQRYSFKLKQALRMVITKLKSTLKNTTDLRLGTLQLSEDNKRINNLNIELQKKLAAAYIALDSKFDSEQSLNAPSSASLQDDAMIQISYSFSESRVEDGDTKSVKACSESTEATLHEFQRSLSSDNLTNYSNMELISRIEELQSRNKKLLQRLDREIKMKLKVEEMRRAQQAEIKQIKKNLFHLQEKPSINNNYSNSNHILVGSSASASVEDISRASSVSSIDSSILFVKKFPPTKATAADKLVNLSLSMNKNAEAVDRLLIGWTITQHFKFSFSKEKVAVVDVFSRSLRIMPPRSNSKKLSGEVVELIKIQRVDKGINPSVVSKSTSKISISSCVTLQLADGNSLDFELASSEERDEFFEGILGILARFNPEFRSAGGGVSYYPSIDANGSIYGIENEDSVDKDMGDSSLPRSPRGSITSTTLDFGKSRRLKLPRGSSAVGALKDAGVLQRREIGLRELGLISDDEHEVGDDEVGDGDDDNSTILDKDFETNITGTKSTLASWLTKRKVVDVNLASTDTSIRLSIPKQNPNSIAPYPYDPNDRTTGDSSKSTTINEAEILFGEIYGGGGTPSKSKAFDLFGNSPSVSASEFFTDNPISAPEGESPFMQEQKRKSYASKDISNKSTSNIQNSHYEGFSTDNGIQSDSINASAQRASKQLSGIQITPYSFENGYQQLNKASLTGSEKLNSGSSFSATSSATGMRTSASRMFAADHAAFRKRILEGKAAREALQKKQEQQQVVGELKEEEGEEEENEHTGNEEMENEKMGELQSETV